MATGTGNLPYPGKVYNPFDILTAEELNEDVANIESLADGTGLGDLSVPNSALANQAWQSWTPSWTNVSGGTLNYAKWTQIGKTVYFKLKYTLAGAGVSGGIAFTTPTNTSADYANFTLDPIGDARLYDLSTTNSYFAGVGWGSTTTLTIRAMVVAGTFITQGATSATVPFTWASGDIIFAEGSYEAA